MNSNSVEFNGYFLKYRFKSTSAYHKANINTLTQHKNSTNTHKTKQTKRTWQEKSKTKEVLGKNAKPSKNKKR